MATDHPDRQWITQTIAALQDWLEVQVASPTSQVTGGGAVGIAEHLLSTRHGDRPSLLMPSATFGMLSVLSALGVGQGDEILIPELDWPATLAAVQSLGATPVPVPVSASTWTIDPHAARALRTERTRAVVACHLFGIPADVPALRDAVPHLDIVEDCAQAFGSTLDGSPVGSLGDAAVFSFGPGKRPVDVGEAGAVVLRDESLRRTVLRRSAHPVRQLHGGVFDLAIAPLNMRVHPLAAVLLSRALEAVDCSSAIVEHRSLVANLLLTTALPLLGSDARRGVATRYVTVDADELDGEPLPADIEVRQREVHDIRSILAGPPRVRRVAFLTRISRAPTAADSFQHLAARQGTPDVAEGY